MANKQKHKNLAEKKIAKHKKHGFSYADQLGELQKIEDAYEEKGMELSSIQQKRKELLNEKLKEKLDKEKREI